MTTTMIKRQDGRVGSLFLSDWLEVVEAFSPPDSSALVIIPRLCLNLLLPLRSPAISLGFTICGEIFAFVTGSFFCLFVWLGFFFFF